MINHNLFLDQLGEQGFHIHDHFLDDKSALLLRSTALELVASNQFQPAKIGSQTHATPNKMVRSDKTYWLDETSPNIKPFWQAITQVKALLNQTFYLGLEEFETHFALYQAGSFYKKHIDQFRSKKNRQISFVYYLNPNWQANFGGCLTLYNNQHEMITSILPTWNRFVCFLSNIPHEVHQTTKDRLSITGWIKTKEAPALLSSSSMSRGKLAT